MTEAQLAMRTERANGATLKELSAKYGLSVPRVGEITKGCRPQTIKTNCVMRCKHCRNEIVGNQPRTVIITVDKIRAFVHVLCTVDKISSDRFGKALAAAL